VTDSFELEMVHDNDERRMLDGLLISSSTIWKTKHGYFRVCASKSKFVKETVVFSSDAKGVVLNWEPRHHTYEYLADPSDQEVLLGQYIRSLENGCVL